MYHARTVLVSEAHRLEREIDILETEIELGEGTKAQFKELERLRIALAETLDAINLIDRQPKALGYGIIVAIVFAVVGLALSTLSFLIGLGA